MQVAAMAEPYVGKYFSVYQVRNRLLGYTDGEIKEIDKQISYERNVGIIPDPEAVMQQQASREQNAGEEEQVSGDFQGVPGEDPMAGMGGGDAGIAPM